MPVELLGQDKYPRDQEWCSWSWPQARRLVDEPRAHWVCATPGFVNSEFAVARISDDKYPTLTIYRSFSCFISSSLRAFNNSSCFLFNSSRSLSSALVFYSSSWACYFGQSLSLSLSLSLFCPGSQFSPLSGSLFCLLRSSMTFVLHLGNLPSVKGPVQHLIYSSPGEVGSWNWGKLVGAFLPICNRFVHSGPAHELGRDRKLLQVTIASVCSIRLTKG